MKPGVPWSVKGIEPQAREAAKDAARKAGMTLGEWLNHTIMETGGDAPEVVEEPVATQSARRSKKTGSGKRSSTSGSDKPAAVDADGSDDATRRIDALTRRIGALADPETDGDRALADSNTLETAPATAKRRKSRSKSKSESKAVSGGGSRVDLSGVTARLDQTDQAMAGLQDGLDRISTRLNDMPTGADRSSIMALEGALENVVEHIELTDRRNSDVLKAIQSRLSDLADRGSDDVRGALDEQREGLRRLDDRLGALADRIDASERRDTTEDYRHLEDRIAKIGQSVDQIESAPRNQPAIDALESRFSQIASKLSMTERMMAPQSAVNSLKGDMDQLKSELARRGEPTKPALVQALESRLNTMSSDIEGLRANAASSGALAALDHRLDDIVRRLSSAESDRGDRSDVSALEQRVATLARRLDESVSGAGAHPEIIALERRFDEFASRMDSGASGGSAALDDLESRVTAITDRLDRAERHFEALPGIESNLSQLFESLENSRNAAIQAAEQAAYNAAHKIIGESGSVGPDQVAASDALSALERGLAEVKSQTTQTDKHNQETLEAVHDTLKRVVDRLGTLEEKSVAAPMAPPRSPAPDDRGLDDFRLPPLPDLAVPTPARTTEAPASPAPKLEVPEPAVRPADRTSASAEERGGGENMDFARAYEGAFATASDESANGLTRNKDFIAAARRAAQAASQGAPAAGAAPREEAPDTGEGPPRGGLRKGRRRSLLFAAAALFIVAGALSVSGLVGGGRNAPATNPPVSATTPGVTESLPAEPEEVGTVGPRQMSLILDDSTAEATVPKGSLALPRTTTLTKSVGNPRAGDGPTASSSAAPTPAFAPTQSLTGSDDQRQVSGQSVLAPRANQPGGDAAASIPVLTPDEEALFAADLQTAAVAPAAEGRSSAPVIPATSIGVLQPEPKMSLDAAAVGGDASAQFARATQAAEGDNHAVAAQWYQKAAAQGLAPAQYRLGALYEKGKGVAKDLGAAQIWYQRAAEQGNAKAMHNLAVLLAGGAAGGRPDYTHAARWFQKAAQLGLADSQYNLAVLHERGLGVEKDSVAAYSWFAIAAATGDGEAGKRMKELAGSMEAVDLASATARYESWRPAPLEPAANEVDVTAWADVMSSPQTVTRNGLTVRAQRLLSELGYDPGPADGLMGPRTREALAAFARERGLDASGRVSADLVQHLEAAVAG